MKNQKEQFETSGHWGQLHWGQSHRADSRSLLLVQRFRWLSGSLALMFLLVVSSLDSGAGLLASCGSGTLQKIQIRVGENFQVDEIEIHRIELGAGRAVVQRNASGDQEFDMDGSNATLKTDPELESTLKKAERYRDDGNYAFACKLWQLVLENSGDTLYSEDNEHYFSMVQEVERILATLPEKGLAAYRVLADADAKQILAKGRGPLDEQALSQVVRSYFISSVGDESAFKLASIYMDQHNFIGAERLLRKIVEYHPDPTVPLDEVYVRIALCYALTNNVEGAKATLEQAQELSEGTIADLVSIVSKTIEQGDEGNAELRLGMSGNRFSDFRVMPSLPKSYMDGDLVCVWQAYLEPAKPFKQDEEIVMVGPEASGQLALDTLNSRYEKPMIERWREKGWQPAGELVFGEGKVFFKSPTRMTAWNTENLNSKEPAWKSVWTNDFPLDDATKTMASIARNFGRRNTGQNDMGSQPSNALEVQLFGDRVFQRTTLHDGTIYTLEGPQFDTTGKRHEVDRNGVQYNTAYRRSRSNYLVAYDAETGKVKWTVPRIEEGKKQVVAPNLDEEKTSDFLLGGGMMSAPIGFDNLLLVPVNIGGAIMVYALDAENEGKTVWKSFLCDEPDTGAVAWAPINLSIRGSDLYVATGMGVVFVLDASTGLVQLAKRYPRVGEPNTMLRNHGWKISRLDFDGWSADEVIPYGNQLICFSSDAKMIQALNATDASLIWEVEMMNQYSISKLNYILGIHNDVLYLAGPETVLAFDLKQDGKMIWGGDPLFDGKQTCGRGVLTPDGIYMPIEDSIWKFAVNGDANFKVDKIATSHVDLGIDAPVGNLYSDGTRIWVHGGNRIYALAPETKKSNGK